MKRHLLLKGILWLTGIIVSLVIILQILLSSSLLPSIINKVAANHIDGDISFGKAEVSIFRRFPKITMTLEDFSVTYPAEKFDSLERVGVQSHMVFHGCGEEADTLASFKEFSASIRLFPLLSGQIHIPHIDLVKPRIFAHSYDEHNANWNIFKTSEVSAESHVSKAPDSLDLQNVTEPEEVSEGSGLPSIVLGHIQLSQHPHIVFTDSRDTLFAMIDLKYLVLDGTLKSRKMSRTRIGMRMDSLFVAGRMGRDTVAFGLDKLGIREHRGHMDFEASAKAFAATRSFGRLRVPMDISGAIAFPKDTIPHIRLDRMEAEVAGIPLKANADITLAGGKTGISGNISVNECSIQGMLSNYLVNFIPEAKKVKTDCKLNIEASIDGTYDSIAGTLPDFKVSINIPEAGVRYTELPYDIRFGIDASASKTEDAKINVVLNKIKATGSGLDLTVKGGADDLLGNDPQLSIDTKLNACLDSLQKFLPDSMNVQAKGSVNAHLAGKMKMSQLDIYNFADADLKGEVTVKNIDLNSPGDTLSVAIDSLGVTVGPEVRKSRKDPSKSFKMLAINGHIRKADINFKEALFIKAKDLTASAKNSLPEETESEGISYFSGTVGADLLSIKDAYGSRVMMHQTKNTFRMMPKRGQPTLPVLTFTSDNKRISLMSGTNRAVLSDSKIKAKAAMNTIDRKLKMQAFMDSLAKQYPEIPRDSLLRHAMSRRSQHTVPAWMQEEDFKSSDIDIRLDNTLAKYFREWDLNGNISVGTGLVMTPQFPLRNSLKGFSCSFNNDMIAIDSLKLTAGKSKLSANGKLTGLRMALLRKGLLKLDVDITSDGMDANELLRAYNAGSSFKPENHINNEDVSDEEYLEMVMADTTSTEKKSNLIVIPANLNANISVDASHIRYSDLDISKATAELIIKERCVQITGTRAVTNMGDITFDGFYSTRSKQDLKSGFSLNLIDITAEKVIDLMPSVDTIMPLLKSFKGLLNCEIAGTARIDTSMNLVMPSINGIIRIGGENLSISDNELFNTLARKLMFKNKKEGKIDKMTVEGVIKDNVMEIFPFVMSVDRYSLAMSGKQNLDMSFKYHVSVIKSPLVVKMGIDLYGTDFDHLKFKIGKAKYKSEKVPVFSTVIDQTKVNLLTSIKGIFEKGVEAAIKENEGQDIIRKHKEEIQYVNATDVNLEELSEAEQQEIKQEEEAGASTLEEAAAIATESLKETGVL